MTFVPEFHPAVRDEIDDAHEWYVERLPQLGSEFLNEFEILLKRISNNPTDFAFAEPTVRFAILNRFPYAVYFRFVGARVRVLAVLHTSRDPSIWKSRS